MLKKLGVGFCSKVGLYLCQYVNFKKININKSGSVFVVVVEEGHIFTSDLCVGKMEGHLFQTQMISFHNKAIK